MRIIKCDYCGAEIEEDKATDVGWSRNSGMKLNTRWRKDCCPRCQPKKELLKAEEKNGEDKKIEELIHGRKSPTNN